MQFHKYAFTAGMCKKQQHQFHVSSAVCSYHKAQCTARHTNISTLSGIATDRILVSAVAYNWTKIFKGSNEADRLCGLVVRGPGFDPRRYQIFWLVVGLERGPLSLVSLVRSIEELLEWKK